MGDGSRDQRQTTKSHRDFDFDIGSGLTGDNVAPRGGGGNLPVWSSDGRSINMVYVKEGKANVGSFDVATGRQSDVTTGNQAVVNFRALPDASKFVLLISTPTRIGDLLLARQTRRPAETTDTSKRRVVFKTESHRARRNLALEL